MGSKLRHNILGVDERMSCIVSRMISLVRWVNVLFINPRDCIALADALSHCSEKFGLDVIHTPRSFSDDAIPSLVLVPGADPGGALGAEAPLHIWALLDQYAEYYNEILS